MLLKFKPDPTFKEKRIKLVNSLVQKGKLSQAVLAAMLVLPREIFINKAFINRAYEDHALPIECNQTISQPFTVAYMTTLLDVKPNDKILEIGTGSGYQAALLCILDAIVFSVERIEDLYLASSSLFNEFGFPVNQHLGDGSLGWSEFQPFDGIIVTAASPKVPIELINQLAKGGRLVVPIGDRKSQVMHRIIKTSDGKIIDEVYDKFQFVPLIGEDGWKEVD